MRPVQASGKLLRLFAFLIITSLTFSHCSEHEDENINPGKISEVKTSLQRVKNDNLQCSSCDFVVPAGVSVIDGRRLGIKPGDIVCLNAALKYNLITFENIIGTPDLPVTVRNCDGTVTISTQGTAFVLRFNNSKYLRISGGESDNTYGIRLTGAEGNGLVMGYLTSDFEVDHLEVYRVGFSGIMAKTDPSCDNASVRGNYTMRNVSFHHNYIHDTHGEGFYLGHTSYGGKETPCGVRLPHTIENIRVYSNLVRNSGWDGIQVSSAPVGAEIYDNVVENYATGDKPAHSFGIIIGGGTGGKCYNNYISRGSGAGIGVLGIADNLVFNNIIRDAGGSGIFCDERTPPGAGYRIVNNTIVNAKDYGVLVYAETVQENLVQNNIIVNPGALRNGAEHPYIKTLGANVKLTAKTNLQQQEITRVRFVNAGAADYRLQADSPAVNAGSDVSVFGIAGDFYSGLRVVNGTTDIGAAEHQ